MPERFPSPESAERLSSVNPMWLGGFFEIGGSIWIGRHTNTKLRKPYTWYFLGLSYSDNDKELVASLKEVLGGNVYDRANVHSFDWRLVGRNAFGFAQEIKPYVPSRQRIIEALEKISQFTEYTEKESLFEQIRQYPAKDIIEDPNTYTAFLEDPHYVAGILDNRGRVADYPGLGPRVEISTDSSGLVTALAQRYRSSLIEVDHEGTTEMVAGREYPVNKNRFVWVAGKHTTQQMLQEIGPHLMLRKKLLTSFEST